VDAKIKEALSEAVELWMDVEGVNGVAVSEKEGVECLLVTVEVKTPEVLRSIPSMFKGYSVEILVTGPITAQEDE
jgi:hypothetical protein